MHKEPKATKGEIITGLQKEPNTRKESKGLGKIKITQQLNRVMKMHLKITLIKFQKRTLKMSKKIKTNRNNKSTWKTRRYFSKQKIIDTETDPSDGDDTDHFS